MWTVSKEFRFEAAHSLPHLPEGHKCRNVHGHSYKVSVVCAGDLNPELSWVIDYNDISSAVVPLIEKLDHKDLNEVLNTQTTAENIAYWFWHHLKSKLPSITCVHVWETPTTCCTYTPNK